MIPIIGRSEFGEEFVRDARPCVLADALVDWPALGRWSPEYLRSAAGDRSVMVTVSRRERCRRDAAGRFVDPEAYYGLPNVPFTQAVDWITDVSITDRQFYLPQEPIRRYPELIGDLRLERPLESMRVSLWFGSGGTTTPLHYDRAHNLFAQVYGSKRVTLVDPEHVARLYPYPDNGHLAHVSAVNLEEPDLAEHPLFADVERHTIVLAPGQMIFIPAFWWHHVVSTEVSISLSQWWDVTLREYRSRTAQRQLIRDYRRDGWLGLRAGSNLTARSLLELAAATATENAVLAVLAASVAVEESERWPTPGRLPPIDPAARQCLQQLLDAVVNERDESVSTLAVADAVGALCPCDAVANEAFAR